MTDKETIEKLLNKVNVTYVEQEPRDEYVDITINGCYADATFTFDKEGELTYLEVYS